MPKLPLITAQGGGDVLRIAPVSSESFGAQAGQGLAQFGQAMLALDQRLQAQRDQLDLARVSSDYEQALDGAKAEATKLGIGEQGPVFAKAARQLQKDFAAKLSSGATRNAFLSHAEKSFATQAIDLAHQGRTREAQRQIVDYDTWAQQAMDRASGVDEGQAREIRLTVDDLSRSMERSGLLSPEQAQKSRTALTHRYWEQRALKAPSAILTLAATNQPIPDMDNAQLGHYVNLAVNQLKQINAQQARDIKDLQDDTERRLMADVLQGGHVRDQIPALLRDRRLDATAGRQLVELDEKMQKQQDAARLVPGLAAQIEAGLRSMKYSESLSMGQLEEEKQTILTDFLRDAITKDEFTHLMTVWQDSANWLHQEGKEPANKAVGQAHTNLIRILNTVGPADKYDALSSQTVAAAEKFFYARLGQDPKADPWAVADEAERIFKPVIEKRIGLSKEDATALTDAKMHAMKQTKALSEATYKAYQGARETQKRQQAVDDALAALPKPQDPGWLERTMQWLDATVNRYRQSSAGPIRQDAK